MQFYQVPVWLSPQLLFCHSAELSCWDRGHLACRAENVHILALLRHSSQTLAQRVRLSKVVGEGDPKWPNGLADWALEDSQPPGASLAPQAGKPPATVLGTLDLPTLTRARQLPPLECAQQG